MNKISKRFYYLCGWMKKSPLCFGRDARGEPKIINKIN